jgi:hypothetical protein
MAGFGFKLKDMFTLCEAIERLPELAFLMLAGYGLV